jgi:hypothetical protein
MNDRLRSALSPLLLGVLVGVGVLALHVRAGDLVPPTGPVAPTGRIAINPQGLTLPYTIDQPGSYVLMGNIVAPGGFNNVAIIIAADDVTLDLNGFAIIGDGNGAGILASGDHNRACLRNGTISHWQTCVSLQQIRNSEIAHLRVTDGEAGGILAGDYSVVTDCTAHDTGNVGVQGADSCVITRCAARHNVGYGITGGQGSVITNCTANFNGNGIYAATGSVIANCAAYVNSDNGIVATDSLIRANTARSNTNTQIDGSGNSTLVDNH